MEKELNKQVTPNADETPIVVPTKTTTDLSSTAMLQRAATYKKFPKTSREIDADKMTFDYVIPFVEREIKKNNPNSEAQTQDVAISTALLIHDGASLSGFSADNYVNVESDSKSTEERATKLTVGTLRRAFKRSGLKNKIRQFAHVNATDIALLAQSMDRSGTLTAQLQKIARRNDLIVDPNLYCWCSEFQIGNPNCPSDIAALLALYCKDRTAKQVVEAASKAQKAAAHKKATASKPKKRKKGK